MRKAATKALYLFLCSILGMVLFAMLHRAIIVLYDLLIFVRPEFAFGLTPYSLAVGDFLTMLIALFLGGWYGTMMGIDWYAMVYGPNAAVRPGMFHGFIPHHWRGRREKAAKPAPTMKMSTSATAPKTTTVKVRMPDPEPEEVTSAPRVREWTFEDLMPPKPAAKKKAVAKKTTARKTARKTTVKKVAKTE